MYFFFSNFIGINYYVAHLCVKVYAVNVVGSEVEHHEELEDAGLVVQQVRPGQRELPPVHVAGVVVVEVDGRGHGAEVVGAVAGAGDDGLGGEELSQGGVLEKKS